MHLWAQLPARVRWVQRPGALLGLRGAALPSRGLWPAAEPTCVCLRGKRRGAVVERGPLRREPTRAGARPGGGGRRGRVDTANCKWILILLPLLFRGFGCS